jgi:hypothetical protein
VIFVRLITVGFLAGGVVAAVRNGSDATVISLSVNATLDAVNSQVGQALRDGRYPWYDSETDRLKPVWPAQTSWMKWLGRKVKSIFDRIERFFERIGKFFDGLKSGGGNALNVAGNSIGMAMLVLALVVFFVFIALLWMRMRGEAMSQESDRARLGTAALLGDLPEGIRPGDGDPWAEAQRRREAGDLAGAIVCLFAHQLLSLDQLGLIRLAPGRTGRHYLKDVRDPQFADSLGSTLRLFEDVYYGRRSPTAHAFELVWNLALRFQERRRLLREGALR